MRNKKAPSLAAVGAGKKGGKVVNLACPHSATPPRSAQSECCANCQFFRVVALASGHDRKLCMMTGEKLRTAAGWCDRTRQVGRDLGRSCTGPPSKLALPCL